MIMLASQNEETWGSRTNIITHFQLFRCQASVTASRPNFGKEDRNSSRKTELWWTSINFDEQDQTNKTEICWARPKFSE